MTCGNSAERPARSGHADSEARPVGRGRTPGSAEWGPQTSATRGGSVPSKPAGARQRLQPHSLPSGWCAAPAGGVAMVSGVTWARSGAPSSAPRRGGAAERSGRGGSGRSWRCCQPSRGRPRSAAAAARSSRAPRAARRASRAAGAQCAALAVGSAASAVRAPWRPPGPRPVRGRGEGGAEAPAAREAG